MTRVPSTTGRGRRSSARPRPNGDRTPNLDGESFGVVTWEPVDLRQALVVVGFPSFGLVGSLATAHLVKSLKLRPVGAVISALFPPTAVVYDGIAASPVRVYLGDLVCGPDGKCEHLCVIHSDIAPQPKTIASLAHALVGWAKAKGAQALVCLEGMKAEGVPDSSEPPQVLGVAGDPPMRDLLDKLKVPPLEEGLITGVGGVALYFARAQALPALCLLTETAEGLPNARGAARLLEVLRPMVPLVPIDERPLYETARAFEEAAREQAERSRRAAKDLSLQADVMFG